MVFLPLCQEVGAQALRPLSGVRSQEEEDSAVWLVT